MNHLEHLISRYPSLSECKDSIQSAVNAMAKTFESSHNFYVMGNGGSAADALHIVGELVKSFVTDRCLDDEFVSQVSPELAKNLEGALPAYALVENSALSTAYANDVEPVYVFAQQVYAYARKGDCVMGISTSGNSRNVLFAMEAARGRGAITIGLTGRDGGKLKDVCDICIIVPETETFKIQELHLPVYHAMCIMLEDYFWGKK